MLDGKIKATMLVQVEYTEPTNRYYIQPAAYDNGKTERGAFSCLHACGNTGILFIILMKKLSAFIFAQPQTVTFRIIDLAGEDRLLIQ